MWKVFVFIVCFAALIFFLVYFFSKNKIYNNLIKDENTYENFKKMQKNLSTNAPTQISKFLFQKIDNSTNILPKIIDIQKNNINLSQNYSIVFLNNHDIDSFVKNEYPEYYVIFKSIINNKLRDNLFAVLLIYQFGGVYLKLGYRLLRQLHEIVEKTDEFLSTRDTDGKFDIYILAAYPKHPILLRYLEITMEMLKKKMVSHSENIGFYKVAFSSVLPNSNLEDIIMGTYHLNGMTVKILGNKKKLKNKKYIFGLINEQKSPLLELAYSPAESEETSDIFRKFDRTIDYQTFKKEMPETPMDKIIPKIVYKTGSFELYEIPIELYFIFKKTETKNPSYTFVYFSDRDMNQFVKENFPQHCSLFKSLIPGAYQADLFRVMVLLHFGGIYLDVGNQFLLPISEIVNTSDEFISARDLRIFDIQFAFLAAYKGHPILSHYLQQVMRNIQLKNKKKTDLSITGPTAFGKAFNSFLFGVKKKEILLGKFFVKNYKFKIFDFGQLFFSDKHALTHNNVQIGYFNESKQYVIRNKFPMYREVMYKKEGKLNYADAWKIDQVFKKDIQNCY